jgi:hypothetical protein
LEWCPLVHKKLTNAKNRSITLRITEEEDKILEGVSKTLEIPKSDLIRNATHRYLTMRPGDPIRKMVFEKEIIRKLFELASDKMLKQFAQMEFEYGLKDDLVDRVLNPQIDELTPEKAFEYHVSMNTTYVFVPTGQNWFEKIDFDSNHGRIKVMGTHGLGLNFSHFIKYLFQAYAEHYGVKLVNEALQDDAVLLTFESDKSS